MISVLPNYTTAKCIIREMNYPYVLRLINGKIEIKDLPKYKVEWVRKACSQTVFSEKNISEIQDDSSENSANNLREYNLEQDHDK